jgi:hypothetical protein
VIAVVPPLYVRAIRPEVHFGNVAMPQISQPLRNRPRNAGGVEEERSIASGDIDGKASGLFEKISRRYTQIQADKRIEAKNLE